MKFYISLIVTAFFLFSCNNTEKKEDIHKSNIHKVIVQEVLHVKEYSYIRVLDDGAEKWIAAPISAVEIGGTYFIGKTMEMKNFESKDLNRIFDTIYFVEKISATEEGLELPLNTNLLPVSTESTSDNVKEKNTAANSENAISITIAELFKNKNLYNNTLVKIKGEVTKFNPAIMGTNWIHIKDGTDFKGEFDLTLTSNAIVQIGAEITIQGKVTLDKDFGAGYFYTVLVENATVVLE